MEYLDIVDENGNSTGETVSREIAHRDGIRHRTAHVWIVREKEDGYEHKNLRILVSVTAFAY